MPLSDYGALKGYPIAYDTKADDNHIFIHVVADEQEYSVSLNVESCVMPNNMLYCIVEDFCHPFVGVLNDLPEGFQSQKSDEDIALDYVKDQLFDERCMKLASHHTAEINEFGSRVIHYAKEAMRDPDALVVAFGQRWRSKKNEVDEVFGFCPSQGIHNIHRNQGNRDDGVHHWHLENGDYQDGALFFYLASRQRWIGVFCKFLTQ